MIYVYLGVAITILMGIFFVFSFFIAERDLKKTYLDASFLRYFPNEYYFCNKRIRNIPSFSLLIVALILLLFPNASLMNLAANFDLSFRLYLVFSLVLSLFFIVLFFVLIVIGPQEEKKHFNLYILTNLIFMFSCGVNALSFYAFAYGHPYSTALLIIFSLLLIVSVLPLIVLLDKRLKEWYLLEAKTNLDGTTSYGRPKIFILAFGEWYLLILKVINYLISIIGIFFLALA